MQELYKGFKKVADDNQGALLRHDNGHELRIAKSGLSKKHLSALEKLPLYQADGTTDSSATPEKFAILENSQPKFEETQPESVPAEKLSTPAETSVDKTSPEFQSLAQSWGGEENIPKQVVDDLVERGSPGFGSASVSSAKQKAEPPQDPTEGIAPTEKIQAPLAKRTPSGEAPSAVSLGAKEGMGLPTQRIISPSDYAKMSDDDILKNPTAPTSLKMTAAYNIHNKTKAALMQEAETAKKQIGTIDPQRVFHDMSTWGKIRNTIALILGGAGAGLAGGENPALRILNDLVEKDVTAQKEDQSTKFNLYKLALDRTKDENEAYQQTVQHLKDVIQNKVEEDSGKHPGNPLYQQNLKLIADTMAADRMEQINRKANLMWQGALNKAATTGMLGGEFDPARLVNIRVPKEHQESVYKEIERAQDTKKMGVSILDAFDSAAKENTVLKTGFGFVRTPASVLALHQAMQPTFKDLEGTVRQAAMDNTFKNITPAPGDFEDTIARKRQSLVEYLQSKSSAPRAKNYGIDLEKYQSTAPIKDTVKRQTKDGRIAIFDRKTQQFLRYQ
jgi:hypothetical protein